MADYFGLSQDEPGILGLRQTLDGSSPEPRGADCIVGPLYKEKDNEAAAAAERSRRETLRRWDIC